MTKRDLEIVCICRKQMRVRVMVGYANRLNQRDN